MFIDVRDELMLVGIVLSNHKKYMLKDYLHYGTTKLRTSVANALGRYFSMIACKFELINALE